MRYIQRHSSFARTVHWVHTISCLALFVTGLMLFVPAIADSLSVSAMQGARWLHRIGAVAFIGIPILAIIASPAGFGRFMSAMFAKWDADDKQFMIKFLPYLFSPKKTHMPKQHELKSGQRFADWLIVLFAIVISVTGIFMWLSKDLTPELLRWMYLLHDVSMVGLGAMVLAHAYLGAGIFQPYRGSLRLMFGDGKVSEADARYHWGHWAEEELSKGDNVTSG